MRPDYTPEEIQRVFQESDYWEEEYDKQRDENVRLKEELRQLKATPAPDVSDEALADLYDEAFHANYPHGASMGYNKRHLKAIRAVRQALACSSAAVDVPDEFRHGRFTRFDGGIVVDLFRDHSNILNTRNHRRGTGPTLAAAIADARKDGGQ